MISRIWHGYTTKNNADKYQNLLQNEIFVGIENRNIKGYKGIHLLRRELTDETEFITIMWFESLKDVIAFAGQDYHNAVVPIKAQKVLKRYDQTSQHYTVQIDNFKNS
jgi:heme-degrading monooxygenase HmoA